MDHHLKIVTEKFETLEQAEPKLTKAYLALKAARNHSEARAPAGRLSDVASILQDSASGEEERRLHDIAMSAGAISANGFRSQQEYNAACVEHHKHGVPSGHHPLSDERWRCLPGLDKDCEHSLGICPS